MKNYIYKWAAAFEKLAGREGLSPNGKPSDEILLAVQQLVEFVGEAIDLNLMIEILDYVKNDPNYKFLMLDKLESLVKNTLEKSIPEIDQKTYESLTVEQVETLSNWQATKWGKLAKAQIRNLIYDIFAKTNHTVKTFEEPRPMVKNDEKPRPKPKQTLPRTVDKDGDEAVVIPSIDEEEEEEAAEISSIGALMNDVQENIGSALEGVEFDLEKCQVVKTNLEKELANSRILTYESDDEKTRGQTLREFAELLRNYRNVVKSYLSVVSSRVETPGVIRRRNKTEVSVHPDMLKLNAMIERHLSDIGKYIAKLDRADANLAKKRLAG